MCLVAQLDGRIDMTRLLNVVDGNLHLIPILRKRLLNAPLGLARPLSLDDPDFDLSHHLVEHALPGRNGPRRLADEVAKIAARQLDRSTAAVETTLCNRATRHPRADPPLFREVAHHAVTDGIGSRDLLLTLLGTGMSEVSAVRDDWTPESFLVGGRRQACPALP